MEYKTTSKFLIYLIFIFPVFFFFSCKQKKDIIEKDKLDDNIIHILDDIKKPGIPEVSINIIDFSGFMPDENGTHDFQRDIKQAIDELFATGGGRLIFPHPDLSVKKPRKTVTYRIKGPIELKDNIHVVLDRGIRLLFEFEPSNYLVDEKGVITRYEGTTIYSYSPMIRGFNVENITISARKGIGAMPIIDGDGEKWQEWAMLGNEQLSLNGKKESVLLVRESNNSGVHLKSRHFEDPSSHFLPPSLIEFFLCKNISIEGIKLINSPFWVIHPVFSENLIFRNIVFDAQVNNNDGINPESSRNVLIENIIFNNHHHNIAIKAGRDKEGREGADITGTKLENIESRYIHDGFLGGATENVVVRNCVFKGRYAFCIGTEISGGARNIYLVDNIAPQEVEMGIFIKSSRKRGGKIENIHVKNLKLNNVLQDVIGIVPDYEKGVEEDYLPVIRNIYIKNVTASKARFGIRIFGWPGSPIENVVIQDVDIKQTLKVEPGNSFMVNQVKGVELKNVKMNGQSADGVYNHEKSSVSSLGQKE